MHARSRGSCKPKEKKEKMKKTKHNCCLLTIFLITRLIISTTAQLQQLSLLPIGTDREGTCHTFIGTTADENHQLFISRPIECPSTDDHADRSKIEITYHPQEDSLIYSINDGQNQEARLASFLSQLDRIGPTSPGRRNPSPQLPSSSSSQVVLEKQQGSHPWIRTLFDEPRKSSTVLIEVPLQSIGLFTDLLKTHELSAISHVPFEEEKQPRSQGSRLSKIGPGFQGSGGLEERLRGLHYKPQIDQILGLIKPDNLLRDIEILSGSDADDHHQRQRSTEDGDWTTRHSFSEGAFKAVQWLQNRYQHLGARCELDHYLPDVAPNLICKLAWSGSDYDRLTQQNRTINHQQLELEAIVLTAHYDSKGSFGSILAPGVDDNASGCAVLLSIAEILQEETERSLSRALLMDDSESRSSGREVELVFVHFSGTEQGLIGSRSVAEKFRDQRTILLLMNLDMISFRVDGEPFQIGLSSLGPSPESLAFIRRISNVYVPELLVGNSTIGVSDETNFYANGFLNSVRIFERIGDAIRNPHHMKSSDRFSLFFEHDHDGDLDDDSDDGKPVGSYDIVQTVSIAKVVLAGVLELLFF
ncbi:uncharacterized protein PGTG_16990 [Puccinia graminis f. sp. tritici CRL 75-36-700-3]|uniref:Peptide hydrolase n=1 Tax=Puccinia graminis f. sp. tritici (strain CRL 75-36-700-3 / race SCCL) TaxID=418459 RepID=E3L461_PUCGT|nr:uncharacterized protein PGTG_16990 [Puccinia graminis f. sp. tritici CRL 75-36-700-3]EFP91336.2 hypothetical protein PGTG_16990 [Puccinia graminis f. sp. tritici CRL 75-36-700-3]